MNIDIEQNSLHLYLCGNGDSEMLQNDRRKVSVLDRVTASFSKK